MKKILVFIIFNLLVSTLCTAEPGSFNAYAEVRAHSVFIKWKASSASEFTQYIVERSTDGIVFDHVVVIEDFESCSRSNSLTSTDSDPVYGSAYYRLKRVTEKGAPVFSNVIMVDSKKRISCTLLESVNKDFTLYLEGLKDEPVKVVLNNARNKELYSLFTATEDEKVKLPTGYFKKGETYSIIVSWSGGEFKDFVTL